MRSVEWPNSLINTYSAVNRPHHPLKQYRNEERDEKRASKDVPRHRRTAHPVGEMVSAITTSNIDVTNLPWFVEELLFVNEYIMTAVWHDNTDLEEEVACAVCICLTYEGVHECLRRINQVFM